MREVYDGATSKTSLEQQIVASDLKDMPVNFPLRWGRTLPTAFAAPVEEGMMLPAAALPPLQSFLLGPSTVFCVAVVEWTVVMRPSLMPNLESITCKMNVLCYFPRLALITKQANLGEALAASTWGMSKEVTFWDPALRCC